MGLFGKSKSLIPSRIWRTRREALKGMGTDAMSEMRQGKSVLVVAFFESSLDECRNFLVGHNIPFRMLSDGSAESGELVLTAADGPPVSGLKDLSTVIFFGRYPVQGREESAAGRLPDSKRKYFCASLEDQFFQHFSGGEITALMEKLGMKEDEFIEHSFVDKAILRAQEKLGEKVRNEIKTNSEEEWFQRNTSRV